MWKILVNQLEQVRGDKGALQMASRVLRDGVVCGWWKLGSIERMLVRLFKACKHCFGEKGQKKENYQWFEPRKGGVACFVGQHPLPLDTTRRASWTNGNLNHQIYVLKHCGHKICSWLNGLIIALWWNVVRKNWSFSMAESSLAEALALLNSMQTSIGPCTDWIF